MLQLLGIILCDDSESNKCCDSESIVNSIFVLITT